MAEPSTATEMVRVPILGENGRISDDYIPEAIPQSVTAVTQAAQAAAQSANESIQSAASAEKSASSASSSVEQAKTYATNASTYMTTAEGHADDAEESERGAQGYATAAAESAKQAAESVASIGTDVTDAQSAATAAKESAVQAATSASESAASATAADDASNDADASATAAKASETAASSSAEQAANSATSAAASASAAAGSATDAASSATAAEKSKTDAQAILNEANAKFIESATATTLDPGQAAIAEVVDNVLNLGIPKGDKGDKGDTGVGVPDGGSTGDFLQKSDDGTKWFNSEGLVRASAIGTFQKLGDQGQSEEVHDVSVTSNGYVAGLSVENPSGDGAFVYADDTNSAHLGHNRVGVDETGPYLDIAGSDDVSDGRYRYVDEVSEADSYEIPTASAVKKYVEAHSTSNVLVGTATGKVAHAEDAYAEKPREVRVKGRTVKNLWPDIDGSFNGITVSTDDTGLITITGTATANGYISAPVDGIVSGNTYTMIASKSISPTFSSSEGGALLLRQYTSDSTIDRAFGTYGQLQNTLAASSEATSTVATVYFREGFTIDTSVRAMLVEGSEAPDCFTPTGVHGVEPEKLMVAGKNLATVTSAELIASSTRIAIVSGPLEIGKYTISLTTTNPVRLSLTDGTTSKAYLSVNVTSYATFSVSGATRGLMLQIYVNPADADAFFSNAQLELGSTATAYEPPNVTEVTLPELDTLMDGDELTIAQDGTATASRSDGTTEQLGTVQLPQLPAPTFNVYPTGGYVPGDTSVGYERDINITINNMQEVIDGLVGGGR